MPKFFCFLLELGRQKISELDALRVTRILAKMIYHSKLPAAVESPLLHLSRLVTPSYPQALQNSLRCSA